MKKSKQICWECGKDRERCKAVTVEVNGNIQWVCPQCWRDWDYDRYMYEHRANK